MVVELVILLVQRHATDTLPGAYTATLGDARILVGEEGRDIIRRRIEHHQLIRHGHEQLPSATGRHLPVGLVILLIKSKSRSNLTP
jgi:hypothetical protein